MDIEFWIYVAIVVLSILAQARRKKKQQEERDRQAPAESQTEPQPRPISFEDLLREIQEAKNPEPPARQEPARSPAGEWADYETTFESEERSLEQNEREVAPQPAVASPYAAYEQAKADAFNHPSLEETMRVEDTVVRFGKFKGYERVEEKPAAAAIAEAFADFDQVKKAFIMGEVLRPRF
jgi:hypothetical protein